MSTPRLNPSADNPSAERIEQIKEQIRKDRIRMKGYKDEIVDHLIKRISRVLFEGPQSQSVLVNNIGLSADRLQLGSMMELHVFPSQAGTTADKASEGKKNSTPKKEVNEEAPEEMVLSRFDFEQIDPRKNCLLEKENLKRVSLKEMAETRRLAALSIAALVHKISLEKVNDSHLRNLERLSFSSKLQPLQVLLQDSWFLEGEFRGLPTDIDLYTAGILILMEALKKNIIIPDEDNPYYLRIKEGEKLIYYRREPIAGSHYQWETIPFELPSFRDLNKRY